ncbi:hypothetical protein LTR78_001021 [Recurvomyces mirabilis]|uniref:Homeobox domain-containing protein n=1 Tax=Recurvomyces mirabilis TaxID=574656 RepID=A0AAE0WW87_9PEZI|nr:hypothetical protein LTR78_001021 [Recurvomyces mirabilis]KAK5158993.1 hypothetical protein LTS14_003101 [Recurvomyces mirabilis]
MSDAVTKSSGYQWQQPPPLAVLQPLSVAQSQLHSGPIGLAREPLQPISVLSRPPLRTYKSFPYSLGPSSRLSNDAQTSQTDGPTLTEFREVLTSQGPQPVGSSDLPPATFGGSAPTSPAGRLTPSSPGGGPDDEIMEDEEIGFGTAEQGDDEDRPPMTAAELRAQKRKMKRFRLTHNQTRFLMSEFARQPHPDAAHRERLSREIPGLSPRQVQVWFQNRRAKLKRLTTDDRERMLRSRALPANFDMTQALHSPFGTQAPPNIGTPMPSPGTYGSFGDANGARPLTLDTMRRVPDYDQYAQPQYTTPTGVTPALGAFNFTPPQSATGTLSPTSMASGASAFGFHPQESPRRYTYGLPLGAHSNYPSQLSQVPRHHLHDRFARPYAETASSPLRTSMSYSGMSSTNQAQELPAERASSYSEQSTLPDRPSQHRSLTGPVTGSMSEGIGLGFTYANMPQYSSADQQSHTTPVTASSQATDIGYRRSSSHLAGPPLSAYQPYQPSNFAASQAPQFSSLAGHFTSPYVGSIQSQHHTSSHQNQSHSVASFGSIGNQPQQHYLGMNGAGDHEQDDADNSDGGVPLPPTY